MTARESLEETIRLTQALTRWLVSGCGGCAHIDTDHNMTPGSLCHAKVYGIGACKCTGYRHLDQPDPPTL